MDKADLWPDLGASNVPHSKTKMERAHSFAGALRKQTKVIASGSTSNLVSEVENSHPVSTNIAPNITETETKTHQYSKEEYEEWKQTQKLKRQAKKQEKRLLREEELRRQMVAPKGYRVQLVTENVVTKSPSPPPQLTTIFGEFPELGSPVRTLQPKVNDPRDRTGVISSAEHASPSRKPSTKRKDPIIIDLQQMIVPRTKKQVAKRHEVKSKAKKPEEILSGNPLDSSQPVRHRGKVRETPKPKRPTALKAAIIKNRQAKRKQEDKSDTKTEQRGDIKTEESGDIKIKEIGDTKSEGIGEIKTEESGDTKTEKNGDLVTEDSSKIAAEELPQKENSVSDLTAKKISRTDLIHSSRFREYCDHMLSPALDEVARTLLRALVSLQDKAHARDPDKARMRRRMLTGLHEAKKALILKKVTLLILAPDLERCPHAGGLDSKISELVSLARSNQVNYTFCLGRRKLGHVLLKKVPVSCVAIVNADAAESELSAVISSLPGLREAYQNAISATPVLQPVTNVVANDVNQQVVSSLLTKLEHSLQPPKSAAFLQAIEAAEDSD